MKLCLTVLLVVFAGLTVDFGAALSVDPGECVFSHVLEAVNTTISARI